MAELPEAWMRGPLPGVHPLLAPLLFTFQQAREDLARQAITPEQLWARPHGLTPLGFHIRHMAGSIDRLMTYLQGRQLNESQLAELAAEKEPGAALTELMENLEQVLRRAEAVVRALDPAILSETRYVGRRRLPTTVIGLLVHIAEHTQRHLGQAISTARANGPDVAPSRSVQQPAATL